MPLAVLHTLKKKALYLETLSHWLTLFFYERIIHLLIEIKLLTIYIKSL